MRVAAAAGRAQRLRAKLARVGLIRAVVRGLWLIFVQLRGRALTYLRTRRPLTLGPDELRHALGPGGALAALRGPVIRAMPTVAAFEHELERLSDDQRARLLGVADRVCSHVFDLLGSGPRHLGERIDWHEDFKANRRWPLVHHSIVPITIGAGADIKVPW